MTKEDSPANPTGTDKQVLRSKAESIGLEILDAFPFYVMLVDTNHHILFANKAVSGALGIDQRHIVGGYCPKVVHGLDEPFPGCPLEKAAVTGQAVEVELFDPGYKRWVRSSAYPTGQCTPEGKAIFLHFIHDITEQKQAEQALRESEERLRLSYRTQTALNELLRVSLKNAPLEVLLEDCLDHILSIPWLPLQFKGSIFLVGDEPEVLAMRAYRRMPPLLLAMCARVPFGRCLCGRAALSQAIEFADCVDQRHETRYEGILPHGHYCVPILSAGRVLGVINLYTAEGHRHNESEEEFLQAVANVIAGIIERTRAERKVVEYEELSRLKSQLLSIVSHELRSPMAIIKGYATMLMQYDQQLVPEEKLEHLGGIDAATDRMIGLVNDLLDMSRLEAGLMKLDKQPTQVSELMSKAIAESQLKAPTHKIVCQLATGLPEIQVDARRIRQVMDNLIDNAIKYSAKGTEILVQAERKAQEIQISVADQGRGIPTEELPKIFNYMYRIEQRLAPDPGGLGLGLALCQGLVEAHGGRIWAESQVGKGSTFYFTLPLPEAGPGPH